MSRDCQALDASQGHFNGLTLYLLCLVVPDSSSKSAYLCFNCFWISLTGRTATQHYAISKQVSECRLVRLRRYQEEARWGFPGKDFYHAFMIDKLKSDVRSFSKVLTMNSCKATAFQRPVDIFNQVHIWDGGRADLITPSPHIHNLLRKEWKAKFNMLHTFLSFFLLK